jgi:hypothetical protein
MKKVLLLIICCATLIFTFGCASSKGKVDPNYLAYLNAAQAQPKVVEIEAEPGQTITMQGVKKFVVYANAKRIEQRKSGPSAMSMFWRGFFGLASTAVDRGASAAIYIKGLDTVKSVLNTGYDNAGHNASISDSYNTPTQTTTTTSITGSTFDSYNGDNRDNPATSTDSHNSDSHNSTDNHAVDNHAVDDHSAPAPPAAPVQ